MEEQIKPVAYAFAQDFSQMEHECRLIPAYQVERGDFGSDVVPLYSQQAIDALRAKTKCCANCEGRGVTGQRDICPPCGGTGRVS
jgi:RecJ-like exonuclease